MMKKKEVMINSEASFPGTSSLEIEDAKDKSPRVEPFSKERVKAIRKGEKFRFYIVVKSIIDWVLALIAFLILLVPFILIGFVSFCCDPGTVFFRQTRCGRNGKPFKIIKFRTMKKGVIHAHVSAQNLTDEDYKKTSNAWQRFLRKTSIDELPQIVNILLGQMAFIGPRPLVYNEDEVLEGRIANGSIHCKPGLSGLAQVNGRRAVDYESKAKYDGEYYNHMGFWCDLKLWVKTVMVVFTHEGAE